MIYQTFKRSSYRFRRFAHKAYAAFASLHREVTIGRVSRTICDLEMLKAGRTAVLCGMVMTTGMALADESPTGLSPDEMAQQLSLSEVLVQAKKTDVTTQSYRLITSASAADIGSMPVHSIADMLTYLPGIDVRTRGNNGAQTDVSLRGGTFDQVRVLLNGIDLTDAQTGHYALNLPVAQSLIERIEVLDGAINIVTRTHQQGNIGLAGRMTMGMNEQVNPELSLCRDVRNWHINASAEYNRSGGIYAPNPSEKEQTALDNSDYRIANLYLQAQRRTATSTLDIQLGAQYKDVGAGMFYGFGSQTQRDVTHTGMLGVSYDHRWGAWALNASISYRANYDYYRWWANEPTKGANKHLLQTAGAQVAGRYISRLGTTSFGIELRNENIYSTNLGDSIARPITIGERELPLGRNRLDVKYFAQQTFRYNILSASLRAEGHYNTMFGHYGAGQANIGIDYAKTGQVYVNATYTRRLPTYTDLYYNAGNQLGSRDLRPEQMAIFTLGTRYSTAVGEQGRISIAADGFYRLGRDIIDWVYTPSDSKRPYHATNQNQVNAAGCEAIAQYSHGEWLPMIRASYAYTWLDLDLKKTGSRYLDYLSHKFVAQLEHSYYVFRDKDGVAGRAGKAGAIGGSYILTYRDRMGQYTSPEGQVEDYRPVLLLDVQLYWQNKWVKVAAECTNITNRHYYDYGGILQPGAWAKATVQFTL